MKRQQLNKLNLPDAPGVYFFIGANSSVLYIGKATSLRDRVRSYFSNDLHKTRGVLIEQMIQSARTVKYISTDSVLEALIKEAELIKKHHPIANSIGKDDKSFNHVIITKEKYPRVLVMRENDLTSINNGNIVDNIKKDDIKYFFGPFVSSSALKQAMRIIRRIFPFRDKCIPMTYLNDAKRLKQTPCFNAQINLCPGVCGGAMSAMDYKKQVGNIRLFFEGRKNQLLKNIDKNMQKYAKELRFEEANKAKKTLFALTHIQDIAVIKHNNDEFQKQFQTDQTAQKSQKSLRFEGYDIAHMGGTNTVGVMVVLENGEAQKANYRKFHVRNHANNDTGALSEILSRRLAHTEWQLPDVIVIDGGKAQIQTAQKIAKAHFVNKRLPFVIVAVVKNKQHKPDHLIGDEKTIRLYERMILLTNAEAHRFAIKFHRSTRAKKQFV